MNLVTDPGNFSRPVTQRTSIEEQTGLPVLTPQYLETVGVFHLNPLVLEDVTFYFKFGTCKTMLNIPTGVP